MVRTGGSNIPSNFICQLGWYHVLMAQSALGRGISREKRQLAYKQAREKCVMRQDEELGKHRFDTYLRNKLFLAPILWKDGNRNKAPDFYLSVGDEAFI